ncbi:3-hydroxyacyl-CoA dehydrogenase NAD-binding domain-containing protein [Bradyrhizobium cenepequi]|uniref:3-hydroxyacyl-CoA dehydrogenase NAD-binding domain-containing protein n=1 Tax=Bradyrhizobium cenepequi TaxID=2821403 RepID=UPI001CE343E3|nr:3-hydroxyacyl-CoA dehydrogenase NAD-binding domain-containing protein [Bradyrhizobium cenepequi]MCA6111571.1 enoyl-CoA hydratase/isomerase family protein [Bradyrhizobium cenepequi]
MSINVVSYENCNGIGLVLISNPPVNAISPEVVAGLRRALGAFEADAEAKALVIHCEGRTFVAGGDIASFGSPYFDTRPFNLLLVRLDASPRPVVATLHGTVLGGGLELAMACHHRLTLPETRFGMPEVKLGLLPGSQGTQRLPRLAGVPLTLDLILTGRFISAQDALAAGIVDEIAEGDSLALGIGAAERLVKANAPLRRSSTLKVAVDAATTQALAAAAAKAAEKPAYPALGAIVRAVEAAVNLPFADGEEVEAREFERLRLSSTSRALRHLFFAERAAARIPGLPREIRAREVRSVGIVGAGTMGGGIAMNFANVGVPTVLVETTDEALKRGLSVIRKNYEASAAKGKLSAEEVEKRMELLSGSLDYASLASSDLVIEAVFENLQIKREVCARLGQVCKEEAILATNTSTLDLDILAQATGRPADVVGMHFFSPANVMRLLEVVRGAKTAPDVLSTVMQIARTIGKVPVVSGVCYGFIGNRMLEPYMRETEFLLLEGAQPQQIDTAIESLGLAMGPCRMSDLSGVDIGAKVVNEQFEAGELPPDPSYRVVVRKLFDLGRYGQKTEAGYYRYEGRTPLPEPVVATVCTELAREHGISRRSNITDQEIIQRLMYPLINEGIQILDEGISYRPSDIDVVWTAGYGFPDHRGGPMFMADQIGLSEIEKTLEHYGRMRGNQFGYWTPSNLLKSLAASGEHIVAWTKG